LGQLGDLKRNSSASAGGTIIFRRRGSARAGRGLGNQCSKRVENNGIKKRGEGKIFAGKQLAPPPFQG